VKVAVSVHGRFHGFDLARELNTQNALAGVLTTYPAYLVRRHVGNLDNLATIPTLELQRRLCQRLRGLCGDVDGRISAVFGAFSARHLPACDVLVGWSSATLEAIPVAHNRGARVVIERGSSHILHQTNVLSELYAQHGREFDGTSSRIIERELAEYEAADLIAVPSTYAAETFTAHGVAAEKISVNPYGVDLNLFSPSLTVNRARAQILFVGRVGLRKGILELLHAFSGLSSDAGLCLVGPLETGLAQPVQKDVDFRGSVPFASLPGYYHGADVFCLPSWEEGFPLVLLQAMASGLPVVATDATGAADIVTPGVEGEIVPTGDVPALREALDRMLSDPIRAKEMGAAARNRVKDGFDWKSYGVRARSTYAGLISNVAT
tara:strand:+ start:260 stop:1396 length:1137 start_codon:yes stop_codon:yes gene_type:complete